MVGKKGFLPVAAAASMAVVLLVGSLTAFPAPAQAGLFDGIRSIMGLPGEVDRLKEDYREVKESYDSTVQQLEDTKRQAEQALLQAEEYRQLQEKLMADNAVLMEQNGRLADIVEELQNSEEARARQTNRIQRMIATAVLLVIGYFAVSRVARYVMRAQARRK
ncbi:MAG: hypothetical protein K0R57_1696 [Paenibacillaceae bacterium]|nr:hypothetical protein [Paenibacillaceae bacterium]